MELSSFIRDVPDFPKQGIVFKDITTLLQEPAALKQAGEALLAMTQGLQIDKVAGIESRGFLFGMFLAERLGVGFVPIRKPGKLPSKTFSESYALEYGNDTIEMHQDAIKPGEKILLHDDLLATGGTAAAAARLIERAGGELVQASFLIELSFLPGRAALQSYDVRSLIQYDSE
ncbi:adenine phosphoribosyltransferase [Eisenibacter elegans]|jgi:adenine phosphoribosyltransferase|uniref:adenine phosphoribosyltransferase n=1 Tax=Eisenibacter elegans TaxID=997 RepID=UPI0003F69C29|nr:adenine phosphoribosyltransferase [Eisenibacter elegans]